MMVWEKVETSKLIWKERQPILIKDFRQDAMGGYHPPKTIVLNIWAGW